MNRSLTIGKRKYDCSFLEDRSDEIRETFIAPPPSNIGLPDDGTVYKVAETRQLPPDLTRHLTLWRFLFVFVVDSTIRFLA